VSGPDVAERYLALGDSFTIGTGTTPDRAFPAVLGRYLDIFPLMREQARRGMLAPDGLHPSVEAHAEWAASIDEMLGGAS